MSLAAPFTSSAIFSAEKGSFSVMSIELSFVHAKEIALCSLPVEIVLSDIGSLPITNWGKPEWGTGVLNIE